MKNKKMPPVHRKKDIVIGKQQVTELKFCTWQYCFIYVLSFCSVQHKHTHPSCSVPLSSTLITDSKTCQNDWCIEDCCHLITVLRYFFILLCRLGTNLGVLTPVMSWQSSLSSLNLWFTSHPFYIVDVLRLLSSGEGSSWTESTLRSQPVCWAQVWPGVPGLLCRWSPGQPDHNHTANQMWVENQSITDDNWL